MDAGFVKIETTAINAKQRDCQAKAAVSLRRKETGGQMMRTIDADALREVIGDHVTSVSVCPTVDWARGKRQMQEIALEDIENAPNIDFDRSGR